MRSPLLDDDMNDQDALRDALDQLTMAEFGGDSSQILFENVPSNLNFTRGVAFRNQFIFPHRIHLGAVSRAAPGQD